jgi:hypothetical protein
MHILEPHQPEDSNMTGATIFFRFFILFGIVTLIANLFA